MPRRVLPLLVLALLAPATGFAGLAQTYQQSGNLGLGVAGAAGGNAAVAMGTLTLNAVVPGGAAVLAATLYANDLNQGGGLDAQFAGVPLGLVGPTASDAAFHTFYTYQWNVAPQIIPGVANYSFTIGQNTPGANSIAGVALVVVWSDPGEPQRTVTVIEGMQQVGESGPETESATFTGLPAGPTDLFLFTIFDDSASTGEVVTYNGANVGGPIDQNLGFNASLLSITTSSVSGNNTVAIQTGLDHMGWMIAATAVTTAPVPVEDSTWGRIKQLFD